MPSHRVEEWDDYRIEVGGVEVSLSYEAPGIQVVIEGEAPETVAEVLVAKVLANFTAATEQQGRSVKLG